MLEFKTELKDLGNDNQNFKQTFLGKCWNLAQTSKVILKINANLGKIYWSLSFRKGVLHLLYLFTLVDCSFFAAYLFPSSRSSVVPIAQRFFKKIRCPWKSLKIHRRLSGSFGLGYAPSKLNYNTWYILNWNLVSIKVGNCENGQKRINIPFLY